MDSEVVLAVVYFLLSLGSEPLYSFAIFPESMFDSVLSGHEIYAQAVLLTAVPIA